MISTGNEKVDEMYRKILAMPHIVAKLNRLHVVEFNCEMTDLKHDVRATYVPEDIERPFHLWVERHGRTYGFETVNGMRAWVLAG